MRFRLLESEDGQGVPLTPMIDVMFILIIFFLVTAAYSEMESEMDIALPHAREAHPVDRGPRDIVVNITRDGVIVVNREPMSPAALLSALRRLAEIDRDQGVIIRADGQSLHEHVIHVMDLCRQAGIVNVSFPVVQIRDSSPATGEANP